MPRIAQGMKKSLIGAVTTIAVCLLGAVPAVAVYGNEPSQQQSGSTATVQSQQSNDSENAGTQIEGQQSSQNAPARPQDSSTDTDNSSNQANSSVPNAELQPSQDESQDKAESTSANDTNFKAAKNNSNSDSEGSDSAAQDPIKLMDALALANKDVLADGTYIVASALPGNRLMEVKRASTANGAVVQTYPNNYTAGQRWSITHDDMGYLIITNVRSGKVLDVYAGSKKPGAVVQQYASNGSRAQRWIAVPTSTETGATAAGDTNTQHGAAVVSGVVLHSAVAPNIVLDIPAGNAANSVRLQTWTANGSNAQLWTFTNESAALEQLAAANKDAVKDGVYALASRVGGGQVADVTGGSGSDGANVQTYGNNHTSAQRWKVTHDAEGFITLTNLRSGKALDVYAGAARDGANVQQYSGNGTAAQRWVVVPASDGNGYALHSGLNLNLVLDVSRGVSRNGTNVQVYSANTSKGQLWALDTSPYAHGAIESYWWAHRVLGEPKANEQTEGDYLTQEFTNGTIYVKTASDAKNTVYAVQGAMHDLYVEEGGPAGWLGYPVGNEQTAKDRVAQSFEHGSIISRNNDKTVTALTEEISDYWASQKGAQGWLGWPKGSAKTADGRTVQEFDGGTVYIYPNGGTVPSISGKRSQSGNGLLGDSASNITVKIGKYYIHEYANGAILATSETDVSTATVMNGDIFAYWNKRGGMTGSLGLPTGDAQTIGDGSVQAFKNGTVYTLPKAGTYSVHDDNLREYAKQGGPAGKLGFPTSDETKTVRGGVRKTFEHGVTYWHSGSGLDSHTLSGEFLKRYNAQGAEAGDRGFPISGEYNDRGRTRQDFEHGSYWQGGMPAGVYSHNVRWAGQPNNFYCAPASGYMIFATAGRNTAAGGAPLSIEAMAQYMHTALPAGTWEADAVNGMNNWVGSPMFAAHGYPSYEALRNEVMHSYETGYAPMLFTYERRGGAHPNGHANASFGHAMVVDAYNTQDDGVLIADPLASYGGSQKFWDRLGPFREYYMTWSLDSDPAAIITAR